MGDGYFYTHPDTGVKTSVQQALSASLTSRYTGKAGYPDLDEAFLKVGSGSSQVLVPAHDAYHHCIQGGPYVPNARLKGAEARLDADLAVDGTSMTVSVSTTAWNGSDENIFVADRPYLLMDRKPEYGEDIYASGTKDGLLLPDAEIVYVGAAYESGTTVPIVRGALAKARKKGAILQAIPGLPASYFGDSPAYGVVLQNELPDAVTLGTQESTVSGQIKAVFTASAQIASSGGVVTHYGIFILPKSGRYAYKVDGIPECAVPTSVLAIDSASLVSEVIPAETGDTYLTVSALTEAWNPTTGAMDTISSASDYWVCVVAMNQAELDADLRMSPAACGSVTVA